MQIKLPSMLFALALVIGAAFYFYPEYAKNYSAMLRQDTASGKLPRNFRLTHLQASGSAQFSEKSLQAALKLLPSQKVVIVDLREEPHGYLNGDAISWYSNRNWLNRGKQAEVIEAEQTERLSGLTNWPIAILYHKNGHIPLPYIVKEVASPAEIAARNGAGYVRLPVSDHRRPGDEVVDRFVDLVKSLDHETWLHFHCSAGRGRTTTFIVMYDMMLRASHTPIKEITDTQFFNGGLDLLAEAPGDDWKYTYAFERTQFIRNFYRYCKDNPDFTVSWSDWVSMQPIDH